MEVEKFIDECKKSPRLTYLFNDFAMLASGEVGSPREKPVPNKSYIESEERLLEFWISHKQLWGDFDAHFFSSIPYVLEEECRLGSSILSYACGKQSFSLYTIGTAEATMARTIGKMGRGVVKTLSCSPNIENKKNFYKRLFHDNSFFFHGGFFEVDSYLSNRRSPFKEGFDMIIEDTTFQMYSPNRDSQINYVSRNLKNDGILVLIEK